MRNTGKKMVSIVAAVACLGVACSFVGCGKSTYKQTALDGYTSEAEVSSNGGFAVEKGDYVYFINGATSYTDSNKFGEVEKGALMRISKADLAAGEYDKVDTVVPALFAAQNFNSGIYIYGDYVYFATPTTAKDSKGEVQNTMLDLKRAKLDGSETMKDYYFRLSDNTSNYRFVEEDGVVYCLYEEDGALKSFNTETKKTSVLVSGAASYVYDTNDLTNPNVYYTMSVVYDADSKNSSTASYNQLYTVNASATADEDASKASYTVTGKGYTKTYDFDESYLKEQNKEAKKGEEPYDLSDYSTYPYVNLGKLVLDGVGSNSKVDEKFNWNGNEDAFTPDGYTYTISGYQNGGVYFTRANVNATASEKAKLYYLADESSVAEAWNTVSGNENLAVVASDTTNASASAIFLYENGEHSYIYVSNETLYKESAAQKIAMAYKVGTPTLYKVDGEYLYYYATGTNGNNISRIKYTGAKADYNPLLNKEEYQPITLALVDWNSSWYKPEIFGETLLYSNAQSFGSLAYNYIYAAKLGTEADIKASNEAYEDVQEYITKDTNNTSVQTAMQYYFRNANEEAVETVKELYADNTTLLEKFDAFVQKIAEEEFKTEDAFISLVGKQTESDKEDIKQAFIDSMSSVTEEETEEKGLPGWAIALIVVGSVLVVAAGVTVPLLIIAKKKKEKKAEQDATVNAYKKTIDTTDDKSIDVYADDEPETAEKAEEVEVEEVAETEAEVAEEAVEETTEEVSEEANKEE